jgi:hypothetical protein
LKPSVFFDGGGGIVCFHGGGWVPGGGGGARNTYVPSWLTSEPVIMVSVV